MKTIRFKDGFIKVPDSFIELSLIEPQKAEIPLVMVINNEVLYGTPQFIFFSNTYPCNLSEEVYDDLFRQAESYYPGFRSLESKYINVDTRYDDKGDVVYSYYDSVGNPRTYEDWKTAPVIGVFTAEQRFGNLPRDIPYGIEINYSWGRDPRKNLRLLDR